MVRIWNLPSVASATSLAKWSAPPCRVSSDLGQLVGMRHRISGAACAMAGAASAPAAPPAPATPAAFRNLRRLTLAMPADLHEQAGPMGGQRGKDGNVGRHAPLGLLAAARYCAGACELSVVSIVAQRGPTAL